MAPVRRTEGGWELTSKMIATVIGAAVGLITLGTFFVTVTAATVGARQQLANSTPVARHDSLLTAVRDEHDSLVAAIKEVKATADTLKRNLLGLNCNQANYPTPFCDAVPHLMQAGRTRR